MLESLQKPRRPCCRNSTFNPFQLDKMEVKEEKALQEIHKSFKYCNFVTTKLGISFIDKQPDSFWVKLRIKLWFAFSSLALSMLLATEFAYVISLLTGSTSIAEFVASLHIVGYGSTSVSKLVIVWLKKNNFRQLIIDLSKIWSMDMGRQETIIKNNSLRALRFVQISYLFQHFSGLFLYGLTPIALYVYRASRGAPQELGFIWHAKYPFDKHKPIYHQVVYVFEAFSGYVSVLSMLSADLLFSTMASHITMLLSVLQERIRNIGYKTDVRIETLPSHSKYLDLEDYSEEIRAVIKVHQKLISYAQDLEDVFSTVNLICVLLSSVNICCVVFNIVLLEPWMDMSNKLFLLAVLSQMGMLCWYADAIYRQSIGVADAVYESGWYQSNTQCRYALLLLLQRSQKPLCFTAFKFRKITMSTYSSILTTSYSYFTLLYTIYRN